MTEQSSLERFEIEIVREPTSTFDADSDRASFRLVSDVFDSEQEAESLKQQIEKEHYWYRKIEGQINVVERITQDYEKILELERMRKPSPILIQGNPEAEQKLAKMQEIFQAHKNCKSDMCCFEDIRLQEILEGKS